MEINPFSTFLIQESINDRREGNLSTEKSLMEKPSYVPKGMKNEQLKEKCIEFQSILFDSMLKSMRKTVQKNDLFSGGYAEEIYTALLDQEYSKILSKHTKTSLVEALYDQLLRKQVQDQID